jgi:pimeloyl-ACP methyl ester carboxylesterase
MEMETPTYEQAREGVAWFARRDDARDVADACRTLVLDHGCRAAKATLLLHGLSASPQQFIAVARALHDRGHNVFVPRLPRHGYRNRLSEALATMNAEQLRACARASLEVARGLGERIGVAGFSLGGLLAAYLGETEPVYEVVTLSPFLGVAAIPSVLRLPLARFMLKRPNRFYWWDPIRRERQQPDHGYPQYATHAVAHGLTLAQEVMERSTQQPPAAKRLTVLVNPMDATVNRRAIRRLARNWSAFRPAAVNVEQLQNMPLFSHDVLEPKRSPEAAARVAARIVELLDR